MLLIFIFDKKRMVPHTVIPFHYNKNINILRSAPILDSDQAYSCELGICDESYRN